LHLLSAFPNTLARVGQYEDSGLGECFESLTNVQLPSRSHAELGTQCTNEERALTATVFSLSISLMDDTESQIIQSGVAGGDAEF